ncbi:max dimerization protein 1, isoform CRA_a [Rattus norvegicus]|uniref:Max dimerization protein 1, isoform CRA_a n=1 Tax=Rattus norvegicus TaxID=10116 RepID=A6IAY8_RAT|nr:max dimerization protein 1, isoform CRA_a [Rattus norvegicus]
MRHVAAAGLSRDGAGGGRRRVGINTRRWRLGSGLRAVPSLPLLAGQRGSSSVFPAGRPRARRGSPPGAGWRKLNMGMPPCCHTVARTEMPSNGETSPRRTAPVADQLTMRWRRTGFVLNIKPVETFTHSQGGFDFLACSPPPVPREAEGAGTAGPRVKPTHHPEFADKSQIAHKET